MQVSKVLQAGFASIPVMKNKFAPFSGTHSRLIYYSNSFPQKAVIDELKFYSVYILLAPLRYTHIMQRWMICLPAAAAKRLFRLNYCIQSA